MAKIKSKLDEIFEQFCNEVGTICPEFKDYIPHLVDSDTNAGERFRQRIKALFLELMDEASKHPADPDLHTYDEYGEPIIYTDKLRQKVKEL